MWYSCIDKLIYGIVLYTYLNLVHSVRILIFHLVIPIGRVEILFALELWKFTLENQVIRFNQIIVKRISYYIRL